MSRGLKIVVADDESLIRQYFLEILPDLGHEVVGAAKNGRELVELCRLHTPDLVISDIKMPDMDGIEAAREIARQQEVPVILVSAFHDTELIERADSANVMAYLVKPVERPDIETAIAIARRRFEELQALKHEASDLRQALEDRKIIERAKGILMTKAGLSEPDAFRRLQKVASDKNRKLAEIARMIVTAEEAITL